MSSTPQPTALLFNSRHGRHLFVTDRSRLYDLPPALPADLAEAVDQLSAGGQQAHAALHKLTGVARPRDMSAGMTEPPPVRAVSLNLAQTCNMACGYCYADEGRFGGAATSMTLDVARASVDRLITDSSPGDDLVLGFIGGEPLLSRKVLHEVTAYAVQAARGSGRRMRFSLTTNATLITPVDARLFHEQGFQVSVSLDGPQRDNDRLRLMRDGSSAYDKVRASLDILRAHGRPRHLAARVTVTPRSPALLPLLEHHFELGFDSVGFSAVLSSPDPKLAFNASDYGRFTEHMIHCGERALVELKAGRAFPFGNFETALQEIHRGSHRPYPCGAGAGYVSVGASGKVYACHRVIDERPWQMGDVHHGLDHGARSMHLQARHVDRQQPCQSCWARYLCGGGCYHEVDRRGRLGCDHIRAWLQFCLAAYAELSASRPDYFAHAFTRPQELHESGLT